MFIKNYLNNNYKKIFLLFFIIIIGTFTTSCVKIDTNINIDRHGNAKIEEHLLLLNELLEYNEAINYDNSVDLDASAENLNKKYKNIKNYKAEVIRDGKYSGFNENYNIDDISKNNILSTDLSSFYLNNDKNKKIINVNNHFIYDDYFINIFINYSNDFPEKFIDEHNLTITIPVKAIENNATTVDEKNHTYIWKFPDEIILKFRILNIKNILIVTVSSILILVIFLSLIIFLRKRLKTINKNIQLCPFCGEKIAITDAKCKYCGEDLENNKGDKE